MYRKILVALLIITLAAIWLSNASFAQTGDGFDMSWNVIGGGGAGGPLTGPAFSLRSTIGQSAIGAGSSSSYDFCSGYWCGAAPAPAPSAKNVYLPVVLKNAL